MFTLFTGKNILISISPFLKTSQCSHIAQALHLTDYCSPTNNNGKRKSVPPSFTQFRLFNPEVLKLVDIYQWRI